MSYPRTSHTEYITDLEAACNPLMGVQRWRALKGLLYAIIITANAMIGVIEGQIFVPVAAIISIMLVFGIEIKEIQIADYVSVTFQGDWQTPGDEGK